MCRPQTPEFYCNPLLPVLWLSPNFQENQLGRIYVILLRDKQTGRTENNGSSDKVAFCPLLNHRIWNKGGIMLPVTLIHVHNTVWAENMLVCVSQILNPASRTNITAWVLNKPYDQQTEVILCWKEQPSMFLCLCLTVCGGLKFKRMVMMLSLNGPFSTLLCFSSFALREVAAVSSFYSLTSHHYSVNRGVRC